MENGQQNKIRTPKYEKNNSISAFLRENGMVAVFLAQVLQNGVQYETF